MLRRRWKGPLPFVKCRPTTNPIMPTDDMETAVEFYRGLGFEVDVYDSGYAWVKHCGWEWMHLRLVEPMPSNEASAYLHVEDANTWYQAIVEQAGEAEWLTEPAETPWDKNEFSFTDPSGNLIRLGSPI